MSHYSTSKDDQEKGIDKIPEEINIDKNDIAYPDLPRSRPIKVIAGLVKPAAL